MDTLLLDVLLIVLATARLTRLAVVDTVGGPFRTLIRWGGKTIAGPRGLVYGDELATCPHCLGVYVAAVVVGSYALWAGPAWRIVAGTLAVAYAVGHLVARLDLDGTDD